MKLRFFSEEYIVLDPGRWGVKAGLFHDGPAGQKLIDLKSIPGSLFLPEEESPEETKEQSPSPSPDNENGTPEVVHPDGDEKEEAAAPIQKNRWQKNLIRFLQENFPEQKNIILLVPAEQAYVRDLRLPVVKDSKIHEILPFETENYLPISLDEAEVTGYAWEKKDESSRVISFTLTNESLSEWVAPFRNEEYYIKMMTLDSVAISDAVHLLNSGEIQDKVVGQIHLGASATVFNLIKNGTLAFTRTIPIGDERITEVIAEKLKLSVDDADSVKIALQGDLLNESPPPELVLRSLHLTQEQYQLIRKETVSLYQTIVLEIQRSLLSLPDELNTPEQLYLSGGAAQMEALAPHFQSLLELPVFLYPEGIVEGANPAMWIPILGGAFHYGRPARQRLDFTQTSFGLTLKKNDINFQKFKIPGSLSSAAVLILLFSFIISMVYDRTIISDSRNEIIKIAKRIPGMPTAGDPLLQAMALCQKRAGGTTGGIGALGMLELISKKLPVAEEVPFKLKYFQYNTVDVQFEAELDKLQDVAKIEKSLEGVDAFTKVETKSDLLSTRKVRLNVKIKLKPLSGREGGVCG